MDIRHITPEDIEPLVSLGRRFFDESPYSRFMSYDAESADDTVRKALSLGTCLLAEDSEGIHGFVGGIPTGMWFNRGHQVMTCLAVWISPEHAGTPTGARLVKRFMEICKEAGYKQIIFADLDGVRGGSVQYIYERMGLKRMETNWVWEA